MSVDDGKREEEKIFFSVFGPRGKNDNKSSANIETDAAGAGAGEGGEEYCYERCLGVPLGALPHPFAKRTKKRKEQRM